MDIELQQRFIALWQKYFNNAELPITCFFSKGDGRAEEAPKPKGHSCVISDPNFDQVDPIGGVVTSLG